MINQTTFIYDIANDTCYIQVKDRAPQELTIKGATEYQSMINGTWFQIDDKINHWVSFRRDKFQVHKWEVFYKSVSNDNLVKYYRRMFYQAKEILTFAFSEKDEWVKDQNGRWRSKF